MTEAQKSAVLSELLDAAKHFIECFDHIDRTDYTGRGLEQTVRNFREIFAAAVAKAAEC